MNKPWYDSDNPTTVVRGFSWRAGVWIALAVIFFAALGGLIWVLGVASSPVKGAGDAFKQQQSGTNRIAQQAFFEDTYADFESTVAKIQPAKDALKRDKDNPLLQEQLTGTINYCLDVVADYNAQSRKYLAADFKSIDLPAQLNRNACS